MYVCKYVCVWVCMGVFVCVCVCVPAKPLQSVGKTAAEPSLLH